MNNFKIFTCLIIASSISFYNTQKNQYVAKKPEIQFYISKNKIRETSVSIKSDKEKVTNQLISELEQAFSDILINYNDKQKRGFIIKKCEPKHKDNCLEVCVNEHRENTVCDFNLVEKELTFLCEKNNTECEKRAELVLTEQISSFRKKKITNGICYARSRDCLAEAIQDDISENELETLLSPMDIKKYDQEITMINIFNNLYNNKSQLAKFSSCFASSLPQDVKSLSELQNIKDSDDEVFLAFKRCERLN